MNNSLYEKTEREIEIEKEIRRDNIKEIIALIIFIPLVLVLVWLFIVATPDQYSAEAEYLRLQMSEMCKEAK